MIPVARVVPEFGKVTSVSSITYSEVQELVLRLPEAKLPLAFRLLATLADNEAEALSLSLSSCLCLLPSVIML